MKATPLQTAWIFIRSTWLMTRITVYGVVMGIIGKLTRDRVNNALRRWSLDMMNLLKVKVTLHNPHQVDLNDGNRYVLMANHSSLIDIPVSYSVIDGTYRMMAKKELFKIPLFSRAMHSAEIFSIDRQNREQAIRDLEIARDRMNTGLAVWLFAEGTRSKDGKVQPLKKGGFILAIEAQAWIVPIGIRGVHAILPKKTWRFHLNQEVSVHIGKPISTEGLTVEDKDELLAKVQKELTQLVEG